MASRIAVRLPLHLQRTSPRLSNHTVTASRATITARPNSTFASSSLSYDNKSSSATNNRSLPRNNFRSTFTLATKNQAHYNEPMNHQEQHAEFHTSHQVPFRTHNTNEDSPHYNSSSSDKQSQQQQPQPGSIAFGECEIAALSDLFLQFAKTKDSHHGGTPYLNLNRIKLLLESIGENPDEDTLQSLMEDINAHKDGKLQLHCFLQAADRILGKAPARIVLVVGGPGSGKGALCERLAQDCGAVHLSCGEMLREEVEAQTPLGREVEAIMARGDLVSSAVVTALMRRRMRQHPGRRILLDGFPRSVENARDFVDLCGPPELALHLDCDDTILIERILERRGKSAKDAERAAKEGKEAQQGRSDDNVYTALQRLKNYHKHHHSTMSWLKTIHVPIVELDCSGSKCDVWGQLMAIGRLMRPAVKLPVQQASGVLQQQQPMNGSNVNEDIQWMA